tara:strand:- start:1109 stop:1609 length:501 start_codon:yes stop_codon:yes gene_type:complete
MKKILITVLVVVGFIIGVGFTSDDLKKKLLEQASQDLGIAVPSITSNKYPLIKIVPRDQVELVVCNNKCDALAAQWENIIYIADEVDLRSVEGQSIMYHEMIHTLQYAKYGKAPSCQEWARREIEAYILQDQWVQKQGEDIPWLREIIPSLEMRCRLITNQLRNAK